MPAQIQKALNDERTQGSHFDYVGLHVSFALWLFLLRCVEHIERTNAERILRIDYAGYTDNVPNYAQFYNYHKYMSTLSNDSTLSFN